jgi:hypothetical protein
MSAKLIEEDLADKIQRQVQERQKVLNRFSKN